MLFTKVYHGHSCDKEVLIYLQPSVKNTKAALFSFIAAFIKLLFSC